MFCTPIKINNNLNEARISIALEERERTIDVIEQEAANDVSVVENILPKEKRSPIERPSARAERLGIRTVTGGSCVLPGAVDAAANVVEPRKLRGPVQIMHRPSAPRSNASLDLLCLLYTSPSPRDRG